MANFVRSESGQHTPYLHGPGNGDGWRSSPGTSPCSDGFS